MTLLYSSSVPFILHVLHVLFIDKAIKYLMAIKKLRSM